MILVDLLCIFVISNTTFRIISYQIMFPMDKQNVMRSKVEIQPIYKF